MDLKERDMGLRLRLDVAVGFLGLLKIQRRKPDGVACWGRAWLVASLDFRRTG